MASTPHGASAHPHHESTAGDGHERRLAVEEEVVARTWTSRTGRVPIGSMGQPAATRSAGVAGPTEPDDCRTESRDRARGGKVSSSAALDDASRCRFSHRTGLRTDHRGCGPLSVREAGGELSRSSAAGRFQRKSATAGTHHQARQFDIALPPGGSGASHSSQPPEWRSKYHHLMLRRGRKTAKVAMARRLAVRLYWMMRQGWDYQQWSRFGSHAGQPGNRDGVRSNIE